MAFDAALLLNFFRCCFSRRGGVDQSGRGDARARWRGVLRMLLGVCFALVVGGWVRAVGGV